jgi:hypothetical protein
MCMSSMLDDLYVSHVASLLGRQTLSHSSEQAFELEARDDVKAQYKRASEPMNHSSDFYTTMTREA